MRTVRVIGIDLGSRRVGVAVSDLSGTLASPHLVLERSGDIGADHRRLAAVVAEVGAERVVVGLPLSLDGGTGPAAQAAAEEAEALAAVVGVPVETYDERLTTVSAQRALRAGGTRAREQRGVIDKAAAAVLLQAWLDGEDPVSIEYEAMPGQSRGPWGRRIVIALGILVVAALLVGGLGFVYFQSQVDPKGPAGAKVAVEVPLGSSTQRIASLLEEKEVVKSARNFRLYVRLKNAGPFQAGSYTLRKNLAFDEIVGTLTKGPTLTFQRLTVPEGLIIKQVAALVGKMPGRSAEKFLAATTDGTVRSKYQPAGSTNLEGLLFPDTYNFESKDDEHAILERMVGAFDAAAAEAGIDDVADGGLVDPYQAVVVASLVEREARVPDDRGMVSRVIYNRLEKKMLLQVDATVIYALGKTGDKGLRVLNKDLEVDSPYNTYKNPGLPPAPIASPGKAALRAAVAPTEGPWLYYVVIDAEGRHGFGTTLADHNRNIKIAEAAGVR